MRTKETYVALYVLPIEQLMACREMSTISALQVRLTGNKHILPSFPHNAALLHRRSKRHDQVQRFTHTILCDGQSDFWHSLLQYATANKITDDAWRTCCASDVPCWHRLHLRSLGTCLAAVSSRRSAESICHNKFNAKRPKVSESSTHLRFQFRVHSSPHNFLAVAQRSRRCNLCLRLSGILLPPAHAT